MLSYLSLPPLLSLYSLLGGERAVNSEHFSSITLTFFLYPLSSLFTLSHISLCILTLDLPYSPSTLLLPLSSFRRADKVAQSYKDSRDIWPCNCGMMSPLDLGALACASGFAPAVGACGGGAATSTGPCPLHLLKRFDLLRKTGCGRTILVRMWYRGGYLGGKVVIPGAEQP